VVMVVIGDDSCDHDEYRRRWLAWMDGNTYINDLEQDT